MDTFEFGKIGAIKLIRALCNTGLKEAKEAVDWAILAGNRPGECDEYVLAAAIMVGTKDLRRAVEMSSRTYFQMVAIKILDME